MAGVYISYPFCAQKCSYCNFASGVFPRELERKYLAALEKELQTCVWPWSPETVYLGGGTPGSLDVGDLRRLLSLVPGAPWREATLEAAPGAIAPESPADWRAAGINRVSLGVQSFVGAELRQTGRKHTAAQVADDIALLRRAGMGAINIDLIAGLPGQTPKSWQISLDWVARLAPDHVSVYIFEIDEDSRLGKEVLLGGKRYGAPAVPAEDLAAELYQSAVDWLAGLGMARYEISNFALPGHESLHNLKYWRREPYFGFGSDAHSFDGTLRWQNVESPQEYAERNGNARANASPAEPNERLWLGLRLSQGISLSEAEEVAFARSIGRLEDAGLLERHAGRVRLTGRGVLLSNEVFTEFLA